MRKGVETLFSSISDDSSEKKDEKSLFLLFPPPLFGPPDFYPPPFGKEGIVREKGVLLLDGPLLILQQ